jgi:hypothetical protein
VGKSYGRKNHEIETGKANREYRQQHIQFADRTIKPLAQARRRIVKWRLHSIGIFTQPPDRAP